MALFTPTWPTLLVLVFSSTSLAAPLPLSNFLNTLTKRDHADEPEEIEEIEKYHDHQHSHVAPHILALIIVLTIVGTLIIAAFGMCLFHWLKARRAAEAASASASTSAAPSSRVVESPTDVKSPPDSEAGLRGGDVHPEPDEPDCSWCYISEKKLCGWCSGENQDPPEAAHRRLSSIDGSSMFSGHTRVGSIEAFDVKHSFRPDVGLYTLPSSPRIMPIASPSISPIASPAASWKGKGRDVVR